MISLLEQTLCYVAEEQFESLAFMFPLPEDPDRTPVDEWTTVSVEFCGPFGGRLYLALPSEMLPILGANMLGMAEGPPARAEQLDALKEFINVVCGNLLPTIAGAEAVFNVGAPQLLGMGPAPQFPADVTPVAATRVTVDEGCAELWLSADRPVAALELTVSPAARQG